MFEFFKKIKSISPAEVSNELKKGTQLIDVREAHEFQNGHIKGARNIPLINLSVGNAVKKSLQNIKQS